jgi:hypothetical protein
MKGMEMVIRSSPFFVWLISGRLSKSCYNAQVWDYAGSARLRGGDR